MNEDGGGAVVGIVCGDGRGGRGFYYREEKNNDVNGGSGGNSGGTGEAE